MNEDPKNLSLEKQGVKIKLFSLLFLMMLNTQIPLRFLIEGGVIQGSIFKLVLILLTQTN